MKVKKSSLIMILLSAIMILSTFSYSYTSKFSYRQEEVTLPKERILTNITNEEKLLAISKGFTIAYITFENSFDEVKSYLERISSNYPLYVIEKNGKERFLKIESLRGSREIYNPNLNQTIDLICELMVYQPIDCALREVK
ncbi:MAG: hypothetical protein ACP5F8_01020 [Candidatus Aenigmatarchaeota archaeon]|jgi:hypothetical protein